MTEQLFVVEKAKITAVFIYLGPQESAWSAVSITVREGGFWTGTIAYEDRETVDGRVIQEEALSWNKEVFHLLTPSTSEHKHGYKTVGHVHEIQRREYGAIRANGTCELAPGDYSCGIELNIDSTVYTEDKV